MSSLGKRPREENSSEASRPRKRPGGASRISRAETDAVLRRQQQRAEEARQAAATRGVEEVVRQHYNAVPERGRDWRKTDSRIKGLRSFNNWVKSTIIHKFSPTEIGGEPPPLRVLDIGCGKGGDLGKWQQAPQPVELYVGVDPAEVSIDQARERYTQMRSGGGRGGRGGRGGYHEGRPQRTFDAEFFAEDAFSYSLGDIPIIREVGFGPGSRWGPGGGFDVVSMMFCMHYAFENEVKAKGMLANVAGSLKKGGRFLGVIPNSDVLRSGVEDFHQRQEKAAAEPQQSGSENTKADTVEHNEETAASTSFRSQKPEHQSSNTSSAKRKAVESVDGDRPVKKTEHSDDVVVKKDSTPAVNVLTEPPSSTTPSQSDPPKADSSIPIPKPETNSSNPEEERKPEPAVAEWGNSIYRVRFPGETPKDGIFRPPYGWKYSYFMEEAVEEIPEYVVPWEAFRACVISPLSAPTKTHPNVERERAYTDLIVL